MWLQRRAGALGEARVGPEWELQGATAVGTDHVLARGLRGGAAVPWPLERRTLDERVLSDHAPVDRELA